MEASRRGACGRRLGRWLREGNELLRVSLTPPSLRAASRDIGGQLLLLAEAWPWAAAATAAAARLVSGENGTMRSFLEVSPQQRLPLPVECTVRSIYCTRPLCGAIGAGVRTVPIGHTHGQQVLARVHDDISAPGPSSWPIASGQRPAVFVPLMRFFAMLRPDFIPDLFRS